MNVKTGPEIVAITKLVLELHTDSTLISLRVKPDRRQRFVPFPTALERRGSTAAGHASDDVVVRRAALIARVLR